jgi:hypothetical protein
VACRESIISTKSNQLITSLQPRRQLDASVPDLLSDDLRFGLPNPCWEPGNAILSQVRTVAVLESRDSRIRAGRAGALFVDALETVSPTGVSTTIDIDLSPSMFIYLFPSYQTWWLMAIQALFVWVI